MEKTVKLLVFQDGFILISEIEEVGGILENQTVNLLNRLSLTLTKHFLPG